MTTFNRVFIVGPTRAACANILATISADPVRIPRTLLDKVCGDQITRATARLTTHGGFGVMAGTGVGKTVGMRSIAAQALNTSIRPAIITREHEARDAKDANVTVVTSGIALNYLKRGLITPRDLVLIDEIHETSSHLEFAASLLHKKGITTCWFSATVDPHHYGAFFRSDRIIVCDAFDPSKEARMSFEYGHDPLPYLEANCTRFYHEQRGAIVFVPTRREAEEGAEQFRKSKIPSFFYHAGTSIKELEPFLTGRISPPFIVFMTPAGSSGLNIPGLNTVVIVDKEYREEVIEGRPTRVCKALEDNRLLQQAGRVRGRAVNGEVVILTERPRFNLAEIKPHAPDFKLGADLPHLALACADLGYTSRDLEFLGTIDHDKCAKLFTDFRNRGLIASNTIELTAYGKRVAELPLSPAWAETLLAAESERFSPVFVPTLFAAAAPKVFNFTRGNGFRVDHAVEGSDHLSLYNAVLGALEEIGSNWDGETIPYRRLNAYASAHSYDSRALTDTLLSIRSICDALKISIPNYAALKTITTNDQQNQLFRLLLAKIRSLEVVTELRGKKLETTDGSTLQLTGKSVFIGELSHAQYGYFTRESIEGTEIPAAILFEMADSKHVLRVVGIDATGNKVLAEVRLKFNDLDLTLEAPLDPCDVPTELHEQCINATVDWITEQIVLNYRDHLALKPLRDRYRETCVLSARAGYPVSISPLTTSGVKQAVRVVARQTRACNLARFDLAQLTAFFPAVDPTVAARVIQENPLNLLIAGYEHTVIYHLEKLPRVSLERYLSWNHAWRTMPDDLRLPSGRAIGFSTNLSYFGGSNEEIEHTSLRYFKERIAAVCAKKTWDTCKKPELSFDWRQGKLPPVTPYEYGRNALTGQPLVKYGVLVIKLLFGGEATITTQWFADRVEAYTVHTDEERRLKSPEFQEFRRKEEKKFRREELLRLAGECIGHDLPKDIRDKLRKTVEKDVGVNKSDFDSWLSAGERWVQNAQTYILAQEEKERLAAARHDLLLKEIQPFLEAASDLKPSDALNKKLIAIHELVDWMVFKSKKEPADLRLIIERECTRTYGENDRSASLKKHLALAELPPLNWQLNQDILLVRRYLDFVLSSLGA